MRSRDGASPERLWLMVAERFRRKDGELSEVKARLLGPPVVALHQKHHDPDRFLVAGAMLETPGASGCWLLSNWRTKLLGRGATPWPSSSQSQP